MLQFKNLKQLIDYIPNCLICNKILPILINGYIIDSKGTHRVNIKTKIENNIFYSKDKLNNFSFDINTNEIIQDHNTINKIVTGYTNVVKKCPTCYFIISTYFNNEQFRSYKISPLMLATETIKVILQNNKKIEVSKVHNSFHCNQMSIKFNNKIIHFPNEYLDLSKISNSSLLHKRISTIMAFH